MSRNQLKVLFVAHTLDVPFLPSAEEGNYIVVYGRPGNRFLIVSNSIQLSNDLMCKSKLFLSEESQFEYSSYPALSVDQIDMNYKELKKLLQDVCDFTVTEVKDVPKWAEIKRMEGAR